MPSEIPAKDRCKATKNGHRCVKHADHVSFWSGKSRKHTAAAPGLIVQWTK